MFNLKNKLIIIPGLSVRLGVWFNKFLPLKTSLKIVYNIQKGKAEGGSKNV